ncbi:MAG TPA: hypothetical protein V6D06_15790 [Trichocoleus sp.]
MAQRRESPIRLELELDSDQPELLRGLEIWLDLGLISQEQVRALSRTKLVCALPTVPVLQAVRPEVTQVDLAQADRDGGSPAAGALGAASGEREDFLPPDSDTPAAWPRRPAARATSPLPRRSPRPVNPWLQQLMGELSVVWLLGLGVFLVVLSSAVLAATQWAQFSTVGQYLVLLAYTGAFWGIGQWSATNARLQLTSKTLQIISLLLVPLNLWAIDGLGVGKTGAGWLVSAIATLLLSVMAWWVLRRWATLPARGLNFLGLAYLHFGWAWPWMPIAAVYGGSIASAAVTLYSQRYSQQRPTGTAHVSRLPFLLVLFGLGVLLLRALAVLDGNDWGQLGLAFGLYGAPLAWLGQKAEAERLTLTAQSSTGEAGSTPSANRPLARWGLWGGRALLWWGWLLAISEWPAQALGVTVLGLGLRLWLLHRLERRWDLLCVLAIALQIPFLLWELLPAALRTALITPLAYWTETTNSLDSLLGISLLPYVVGLVGLADYFYRRNNRKLDQFSEGVALVLGSTLTTVSLASAPLLVINLIASTITALIPTLRRQPLQRWRVYLAHTLALMTVVVIIADQWPALSATQWTLIVFGVMAGELLLSKNRRNLWQESAWDLGRLLAGLAYLLLLERLLNRDFQTGLGLLGLSIPLVLLLVRGYSGSVLALGLTAPLTLGLPWTRLVGLGVATVLAATNSYFAREAAVAMLTLGFGLGSVVSLLHDGIPALLPDNTYWYLVGAIATLVLWLAWRFLQNRLRSREETSTSLRELYGLACDRWGFILSGVILLGLTLESGLLYSGMRPPYGAYVGALLVLAGAIFSRFWRQPQPLAAYGLGWTVELLVIEGLRWQDGTVLTLAAANLGLGVLTLGLALGVRWTQTRPNESLRFPDLIAPLRHLALIYALLAVGLRLSNATAWTGWLTLGAALIAMEVGRQVRLPWLRWLALVGISLGWYELVVYQLSRASGGYPADGLVVLAGVALLIMLAYRLSANLLDRRLALPEVELLVAAHTHWVVGSLLMVLSAGAVWMSGGLGLPWLALGVGLTLVGYALWQGKSLGSLETQSLWVYLGLAELVAWVAYLRLAFPTLRVLDDWWGAVACGVAVALYWLPWQQWGWPQRPWRVMAVGVPLITLLLTGGLDHVPSLWITAGFYGWLAWSSRQVRLSYLSVGLVVWAVWVWLETQSIYDSLAFVAPAGLALIYGAQVDPALREPANREARHWFRVVGSGLILIVALSSQRWTGLPVGAMSLAAIALGLVTRTRAYLYVGTVIFGLNAINQLILLNADYPFIKWVIGIVVGIGLIWIAADFERRRDQWLTLAQGWAQEFSRWT